MVKRTRSPTTTATLLPPTKKAQNDHTSCRNTKAKEEDNVTQGATPSPTGK